MAGLQHWLCVCDPRPWKLAKDAAQRTIHQVQGPLQGLLELACISPFGAASESASDTVLLLVSIICPKEHGKQIANGGCLGTS